MEAGHRPGRDVLSGRARARSRVRSRGRNARAAQSPGGPAGGRGTDVWAAGRARAKRARDGQRANVPLRDGGAGAVRQDVPRAGRAARTDREADRLMVWGSQSRADSLDVDQPTKKYTKRQTHRAPTPFPFIFRVVRSFLSFLSHTYVRRRNILISHNIIRHPCIFVVA